MATDGVPPADRPPALASRLSARSVLLLFVFASSASVQFLTGGILNDHYDRISRARQIAVYGELPFRDFPDPGYFLTLYASAFMQKVVGDRLFGEVLMDVVLIAVGLTLVCRMVLDLTGSPVRAIGVTALLLSLVPRLYDYDKVFFYALGVAVCWRYLRHQTAGNLVRLAAVTALAALFRYDNGLFIACAALAGFIAAFWRRWLDLARVTAGYAAAVLLALSPFLVFIAATSGLAEAGGQVAAYAVREGRRTSLFIAPRFDIDWTMPLLVRPDADAAWPLVKVRWAPHVDEAARRALEQRYHLKAGRGDATRTLIYRLTDTDRPNVEAMLLDPRVEDTAGINRSTFEVVGAPESLRDSWNRMALRLGLPRILPGFARGDNATVWLYWALVLAPLAAILVLVLRSRRHEADRGAAARVLSAAALAAAVCFFILRDPIPARVGAAAIPAGVLLGWILGPRRQRPASIVRRGAAIAGVCVIAIVTAISIWTLAGWQFRILRSGALLGPPAIAAKAWSSIGQYWSSPPTLDALPTANMRGLVTYLRQCTAPSDRVMAMWFAPELYYFAGRGFAGGMVVVFGRHWSEEEFQRRIVRKLEAESPPLVLVHPRAGYHGDYSIVAEYIDRQYAPAAEVDFGDVEVAPQGYQVLVNRSRRPVRIEPHWGLPCFAE